MYKMMFKNSSSSQLKADKPATHSQKARKYSENSEAKQEPHTSTAAMRIYFTSAKPFQLKSNSPNVIQLATHINVNPPVDTEYQSPLVPCVKPTIIFESMGASTENMDKVYDETKKYKGNTICVFGLNQEAGSGSPLQKPNDRHDTPHHLINFCFEWTKPIHMNPAKGYKMPFIEARQEIMRQASRVQTRAYDSEADKIQTPISPPDDTYGDMSEIKLYRWIDGDARDDSSESIRADFLNDIACDPQPKVITGAYEWRHANDNTETAAPTYHAFLKLLNEKEASLRESFFTTPYINGNYYLPETTFLMNQSAHSKMLNTNLSHNNEYDQANESQKIFSVSKIGAENIIYVRDLHVTKPFKDELKDDGYAKSLMAFFSQEHCDEATLRKTLNDLRQSAFGKWQPHSSEQNAVQVFEALKLSYVNELVTFLQSSDAGKAVDRFTAIRQELAQLRPIRSQNRPQNARGHSRRPPH